MDDFQKSSRGLTKLLGRQATMLERASLGFKILILVATVVVALSKGGSPTPIPPPSSATTATAPSTPITLYVAEAVLFIATLFVLLTDKSSSNALAKAKEAMEDAEGKLLTIDSRDEVYLAEIERMESFQAARDVVRAILEAVALRETPYDEITVINMMLKQASRPLTLAHGFKLNEYYTICVYQKCVNDKTGVAELVCKAHIRAIDCDLKDARVWREGVGAAGIALARGQEVVVPDLLAEELGSLYSVPSRKVGDADRYRSIVAEPITGDLNDTLWGILVVTSSVPDHFSLDDRTYVNTAQSLAGMIGLAVKLTRSRNVDKGTATRP